MMAGARWPELRSASGTSCRFRRNTWSCKSTQTPPSPPITQRSGNGFGQARSTSYLGASLSARSARGAKAIAAIAYVAAAIKKRFLIRVVRKVHCRVAGPGMRPASPSSKQITIDSHGTNPRFSRIRHMRRFWMDLSYGARGLRNQPGFASIAILTLALGIGAATTIFSVIYNVLLDPFPYADAKRVVAIQIHDLASSNPGGRQGLQTAEFLDYQEQSHVFEEVIGGSFQDALQSTAEGTEQFSGGATTPNMFHFLGVPAMLGRALTPEDAAPGAPPVFVMSYKLWSKRYGLDRSIVNKTFVLNGVPTTLVGIMPPRFTKMGADLWWSVSMNR